MHYPIGEMVYLPQWMCAEEGLRKSQTTLKFLHHANDPSNKVALSKVFTLLDNLLGMTLYTPCFTVQMKIQVLGHIEPDVEYKLHIDQLPPMETSSGALKLPMEGKVYALDGRVLAVAKGLFLQPKIVRRCIIAIHVSTICEVISDHSVYTNCMRTSASLTTKSSVEARGMCLSPIKTSTTPNYKDWTT